MTHEPKWKPWLDATTSTRAIIDQQLRAAGWEVDTQELRYGKGARPKGRNLAIAEWPTASGPADYALFAGLTLVGVVEAKRQNRNVMSVLRTSNVQSELTSSRMAYVPASCVKRDDQFIAPGDLIISMSNSRELVGKVALATNAHSGFSFGAFLAALRSPAFEPTALWYLVKSSRVQEELRQTASQTTNIANISATGMARIRLPVPPLAEQRRIVAKLDALTARTARARADLDRIPALTARYKQVVLAKAFSGELTGSDGAGWTEVSISEIAEVGTGSTPKRSQAAYYHDGVVPWVTSSVVNRAYVDSADQFITEQALRETNCKVFQPGTLLVAMYGEGQTRGRVSVLGIAAATNQALAAISITCDDIVRRDYVYWFLRSQYLALRSAAAGGVQPNLNLGIIKATRIPVPPLTEQVEIVHLVDRAFGELDRMAAEATSALRLIDRLDQAMLAKAFMGELVSQNPSDEPASVLLDRIRAERASAPKGTRGRRKAAA
ncbi:Type-1 restriction enzyme EcoKI specificity protein [compost metagenome]